MSRYTSLLLVGGLLTNLLIGLLSVSARAATLHELFEGESLTVGSARFYNFELLELTGTPTQSDLTQVMVVPLDDDSLHPGFQLQANNQFMATASAAHNLLFKYRVQPLGGGNWFEGIQLLMEGYTSTAESGVVHITQEVFDPEDELLGGAVVIGDAENEFILDEWQEGFSSHQELVVTTAILVEGNVGTVDFAGFSTRLDQTAPGILFGDYNNDLVVDAADYTVWRNALGSSVTLPNDMTPGTVEIDDYLTWKSQFGMGSSPAIQAASPIPEPQAATSVGLMVGFAALLVRRQLAE